jgi:hypothetical protein
MPKSISSVNSSRTAPVEWFLALIVGPRHAAAIVGDLSEMAASRGRLWFFLAHLRTLAAVTWRIVLALFVADVARELMFNLAGVYFSHTPPAWRTTDGPFLLNQMGPLLACIMSTLWFALPFAAVRYGARDRFVQLTFAIAMGTTVAFLFIPWVSLLCAAATLTLAIVTFISNTWRKPLEVLLWTGAGGVTMIAISSAVRAQFPHGLLHNPNLLARSVNEVAFGGSLLVVAFVCSRLHRLLLERSETRDRPLA